jgi:hypothetical protein
MFVCKVSTHMNKTANRLSDMEFDEVSLVTRPANQLSKVLLFKSDTTSEDEMPEVVEEVIEAEAEEVLEEVSEETSEVEKGYGKMSMKGKKMPMTNEDDEEMMEDEDEMPMKKGKMKMKKDSEIEIPSEVFEYIEALEAANEELVASIEKMHEEASALQEAEKEDIFKSADPRLVEIVKAAEERAMVAESIAKAERDFRLEREFVSKAQELDSLPVKAEEFGLLLKSVADALTEEQYNSIWQVLSAANSSVAKSGMFEEVGKSSSSDSDAPMSVIEKAASAIMTENPALTKEQAVAKALQADASLYTQYLREEGK